MPSTLSQSCPGELRPGIPRPRRFLTKNLHYQEYVSGLSSFVAFECHQEQSMWNFTKFHSQSGESVKNVWFCRHQVFHFNHPSTQSPPREMTAFRETRYSEELPTWRRQIDPVHQVVLRPSTFLCEEKGEKLQTKACVSVRRGKMKMCVLVESIVIQLNSAELTRKTM